MALRWEVDSSVRTANKARALKILAVAMLAWLPSAGAQVESTLSVKDAEMKAPKPYWARGKSMRFAAADLEIGWAYVRPRLSIGFGRPFYRHLSLEGEPLVSPSGAGVYFGARVAVPIAQLKAGARYYAPFERSLLTQRSSYGRLDVEQRDGPTAERVNLEAAFKGEIPLPGGAPFWLISVHHFGGLQPGFDVYDESLKVVVRPPWLWRARSGYAFRFGKSEALRFGFAQEVLVNPGRSGYVLRAGILGGVKLGDNLDAQLTFLPAFYSPDSLGLAGADFRHLGIRWRFATDARQRRLKPTSSRVAR